MTQYTKKSFSVTAPGSQQYRDNWEQTFRPTVKVLRCLYCDVLKSSLEAQPRACPNKKGHEYVKTTEPNPTLKSTKEK